LISSSVRQEPKGQSPDVHSIAFSPDGSQLALAVSDRTLKLWDLRTGVCVTAFEGHSSSVWSVAFSPDGQQLASASEDGEPKTNLYDLLDRSFTTLATEPHDHIYALLGLVRLWGLHWTATRHLGFVM
jgi:WD40 repeat protein